MPVTVTASNSIAYHLFQLTEYSTPEPEDEHEIATLDVKLTDGYRSGVLCGFTAGTRRWKLTLPTLAAYTILAKNTSGFKGGTMGREAYIRQLYAENKASDTPFVYLWKGVYYFVDFEDEKLSMQRMRVKLFSTGLTLVQRRLSGVTLPAP